jgi:hypothetical protein
MKKLVLLMVAGGVVLGLGDILPGPGPQLGPRAAEASGTRNPIVLDVAIDCRTWRFNSGLVLGEFARGDGFISNGKIFPADTIPDGEQLNDPNDPGSVGNWFQRGTMAATATEIGEGTRPAFFATWYHLFPNGSGLVVEGPHPEFGPMAVVGGMGRFSGASGQLLDRIIGTNVTGCPNLRLTFHLKKHADK